MANFVLLLQNGDKLLLQNGDKLLLQSSGAGSFQAAWTRGSNVVIVPNQTQRVA